MCWPTLFIYADAHAPTSGKGFYPYLHPVETRRQGFSTRTLWAIFIWCQNEEMRQSTMKVIKVAGYGVLAIVLVFVAPSSAGAKSPFDEEGCRDFVTVNYAGPLERLVPIRRPPPNEERLPFAPHGITLRVPMPTVLVGKAEIGLELEQHGEVAPSLDWTVVSSLSRVKKDGAVTKVIRYKRQHVDHIAREHPQRATFSFNVSGRPSIYAVSSTFFDASGRRLGSYSEYFRIVKHRTEYHQSVSPRMAHGGDILISRTENPGTTGLGFGNGFAIDRFTDGEWNLDPITPTGFAGVYIDLFGGATFECRIMRLPIDMAPGHYRFRKKVEVFFHKPHTIAADFFVLP
jgi:hypothetical protein